MQIFELHFNPKGKEDRFFDSFVYEPENVSEKNLGSLYMVGELTNALPQNSRFLNNLASVLKREYYRAPLKKSSEESFRDSLKKANEFLEEESRKGNVSWLGNLNFSILNFKNFVLNFTKVGNIKILLVRGKEISDIGENLELQDAGVYPTKIFGSTAAGKLAQNDKLIVLTEDVFSAVSQDENFLKQLAEASNEKELKEVLKTKKQIFSEISGVCFLLVVSKDLESKPATTSLSLRRKRGWPEFSFRKIFFTPHHFLSSLFDFIFFMKSGAGFNPFSKFTLPSFRIRIPKIRIFKIRVPKIKIPKIKFAVIRKKIILVFALVLILAIGLFIFGGEREKELKSSQEKLEIAQSKMMMAENLLILEEKEKAQALFQEAWDTVSPLTEAGMPLRDEAISLQKSIEEHLK